MTEIVERENIEKTPFWVIGNKERGYWLALGHHKLCDDKKTKKEVYKHLEENFWQVIICLIGVVSERIRLDTIAQSKQAETPTLFTQEK